MILVNGTFHEASKAEFDYSDRGFTLADGLFETIPVLAGDIFMRDAHIDRLEQGLSVLGFSVVRSRIEADLAAMAARALDGYGVLRLTVTRGSGARGLMPPVGPKPTIVVSLAPFNPALVMEPTTLAVSTIRRNEFSPLSRLKSLNYLDNILALREAGEHGARDCLILNTRGHVACSSVGNVFMVSGDRLVTPPIEDGVLAGITRLLVLRYAGEMNLKAEEASLTVDDLKRADAVFLTNSVRLVQPVHRLESTLYQRDLPALITRSHNLKKIISRYNNHRLD
ncbi:aminotransferase class IV [Oryzibacter oryziterrae]|uniref:aminotransferase class IV n=1 Tax=Oryzibacter oryziterrae TaxID=2766474 RepID=UPI001F02BDCD|nr:aminotransferase class IV [Oryzibacter oryziterrae]